MKSGNSSLEQVYSTVFESALLKEISEKSMLFNASAGQPLISAAFRQSLTR